MSGGRRWEQAAERVLENSPEGLPHEIAKALQRAHAAGYEEAKLEFTVAEKDRFAKAKSWKIRFRSMDGLDAESTVICEGFPPKEQTRACFPPAVKHRYSLQEPPDPRTIPTPRYRRYIYWLTDPNGVLVYVEVE